jgi:hypothetical protein
VIDSYNNFYFYEKASFEKIDNFLIILDYQKNKVVCLDLSFSKFNFSFELSYESILNFKRFLSKNINIFSIDEEKTLIRNFIKKEDKVIEEISLKDEFKEKETVINTFSKEKMEEHFCERMETQTRNLIYNFFPYSQNIFLQSKIINF